MLDTIDFVSNEEHRFKELPIEARHSICLEISKKRRQSVATSIFIPKDLSNHIRLLKKYQRRDSNKKTKLKKSTMNDKNTSTNTIAKYKNKYLKRKVTKERKVKQKPQQPKPAYIKHPESYPIPNKLAQTATSERLRTLLEVLREENASNTKASKRLEIVEQQISVGTDQNLTISYAVEVPEMTTAVPQIKTDSITDVRIPLDAQPATDSVTNDNISTMVLKQEVLDSSYEYVQSEEAERNCSETEIKDYPTPYLEPVMNNNNSNNISSRVFIEDSQPLIIDNNVQQLSQVSQLENNTKQTDCNILNLYGYHQAPKVMKKQLTSSVEHLELQLLKNFQSAASHEILSHNNAISCTTLPNSYLTPTVEHPAPQSMNFYHRHLEPQRENDLCINNSINCNNSQSFPKQPPQPMATSSQTSTSYRHNLHKRHQHYLSYGLQHHGCSLEDPLAAKAWHYTMHKAKVHSSRARRAANAAAQMRLQATRSWHYPTHEDNDFATAITTTHPYYTLSTHTHPQQTIASAPISYVPPSLTRIPPNYYAEQTLTSRPVDLTTYAYYKQSQFHREPPPPYYHHHHYHQQQHQQQALQPQYYSQQQHCECHQHHQQQQQQHYHYPPQHQQQQQQLPTHPSTNYADSLTASYPAQLKRLSEAFAHIPSRVLPPSITDASYWYQLRDLLYNQQNSSTLQGTSGPATHLGHAGTYVNNSFF